MNPLSLSFELDLMSLQDNDSGVLPTPAHRNGRGGWGALLFLGLATGRIIGAEDWLQGIRWADALLVFGFVFLVGHSVTRRLPLQNVLGAMAAASVAFSLVQLALLIRSPFGKCSFVLNSGPRLAGILPWYLPLVWSAGLLLSRETARCLLVSWRERPNFGLLVTVGSTVFSGLFCLGLEAVAGRAWNYWVWEPGTGRFGWYGLPGAQLALELLAFLFLAAFLGVLLIDKRPRQSRSDCAPAWLWISVCALFVIVAAKERIWGAVVLQALGLAGLASAMLFLRVRKTTGEA